MGDKDFLYYVEVFVGGNFLCSFPCNTIKQIYSGIACIDSKRLNGLRYSYLIFRKNDKGSFLKPDTGIRFYLASSLNASGVEAPCVLASV